MPKCALPDHLKDKLHNDWPWPLSKLPRGISAYGPRCPVGTEGHRPWPPLLVEGFDVTRWEWCDLNGNHREMFIPDFEKKHIKADIYRKPWVGILPVSGAKISVLLLEENWWPSIIPTTSEYGWLKIYPEFHCGWRTTPNWRKYYWRWGYRPDFDMYYNTGPYAGRNPE